MKKRSSLISFVDPVILSLVLPIEVPWPLPSEDRSPDRSLQVMWGRLESGNPESGDLLSDLTPGELTPESLMSGGSSPGDQDEESRGDIEGVSRKSSEDDDEGLPGSQPKRPGDIEGEGLPREWFDDEGLRESRGVSGEPGGQGGPGGQGSVSLFPRMWSRI